MNPTHDTLKEKLLAFSKREESGCLVWTKYVSKKGYGYFTHKRQIYRSNRAAWQAFVGEIPAGLSVLHLCDNPACIEITHLYLGTDKDNGADKALRGRAARHVGELNGNRQLTERKVKLIKALLRSIREGTPKVKGYSLLARAFSVSISTIKHIALGHTWSYLK